MSLKKENKSVSLLKIIIILLLVSFCLPAAGCSKQDRIKNLIKMYDYPNSHVADCANLTLEEMGNATFPFLIDAMKNKSPRIRHYAAMKLGKMRAPGSAELLLAALKDKDEMAQCGAAWGLGYLKNPRTVEPLIAFLKDENPKVRMGAAFALGMIRDPRAVDPLIAVLNDKDDYVRSCSADALGRINDPRAAVPLRAALKDKNKDVRERALEALKEIGDPRVVDSLIAALKDTDDYVRRSSADDLWRIKDPRAVEPLLAALKDKDDHVRASAATAPGEIKDPRAVKPLLAALKDTSDQVRSSSAYALGGIKDSRAVEPLIAALKDESPFARSGVAWALGELKDPRAVKPLITTLKDKDYYVRSCSADALGKIKDPRAVEALLAALKDKDEHVRASAADALKSIKDSRTAVYPARERGAAPGNESRAIKDSRAFESFIALLKDKSMTMTMRESVARSLGETKDPRAVEPLIEVLNGENSLTQNNIGDLLGWLGDIRTKISASIYNPLIMSLFSYPDFRSSIAGALSKINDPRAAEVLNKGLKDLDIDIIRGAYKYFIARGEPGSEDILIYTMNVSEEYSYKGFEMAACFLSSGNEKLANAALEWTKRNRELDIPPPDEDSPKWGSAPINTK